MDTTPTGDNFGFEEVNRSDLADEHNFNGSPDGNVDTGDLLGDLKTSDQPTKLEQTPIEPAKPFDEALTLGTVDPNLDGNNLLVDSTDDTNKPSDSLLADFDPIQRAQDSTPTDVDSIQNSIPEFVHEPLSETTGFIRSSEPIPEPIREPHPEPVLEPREPSPEPEAFEEPTWEPARTPTPEPIREPSPEPIWEPSPEPFRESRPTREPVTKPITPPTSPIPEPFEMAQSKPVELPKPAVAPSRTSPKTDTNLLSLLDCRVLELVLWRKPLVTALVFGVIFSVLISLTCYSVLSVISYTLLLTLLAAFGTRFYKFVMAKVNHGDDEHPFKQMLEANCTISQDKCEQILGDTLEVVNRLLPVMRDFLLVNDLLASIKFGLVVYASTYLGTWFNAHTLFILAVVAAFTLPKVYEVNRAKIDKTVEVVHDKLDDVYRQLQDKIPFLKQKQH